MSLIWIFSLYTLLIIMIFEILKYTYTFVTAVVWKYARKYFLSSKTILEMAQIAG
jgi:hypothetical protein